MYLHFPHQMPQSTNLTEEEVSVVFFVEFQFLGWVPLPSRHPNLCNKICIKHSKQVQSFFSSTIDCGCLGYLDQKLAFSLIHVLNFSVRTLQCAETLILKQTQKKEQNCRNFQYCQKSPVENSHSFFNVSFTWYKSLTFAIVFGIIPRHLKW